MKKVLTEIGCWAAAAGVICGLAWETGRSGNGVKYVSAGALLVLLAVVGTHLALSRRRKRSWRLPAALTAAALAAGFFYGEYPGRISETVSGMDRMADHIRAEVTAAPAAVSRNTPAPSSAPSPVPSLTPSPAPTLTPTPIPTPTPEPVPIPESLLTFEEHYPEAADFVKDYPEKYMLKPDKDVSAELVSGEIPLFIQWDERWGYETYGNDFLAVTGCGPTCLSMVVCGLTGTGEWNPYEVAQFSMKEGYYQKGVGSSWLLMTEGAGKLGIRAEQGDKTETYIRDFLSAELPIICSVYPGDFTYAGHFIVLTGMDESGDIIVNDPNSRVNSGKTWPLETLLPQIRNLWGYYL